MVFIGPQSVAYTLDEMAGTQPRVEPSAASRPKRRSPRDVLLVFADTPAERRLIDAWIERSGRQGLEQVRADDQALESVVDGPRAEQVRINPVGVVWLPPDGTAAKQLATLLGSHGPLVWRRLAQDRLSRGQLAPHEVIEGQSATTRELRRRFSMESAANGADTFPAFVRRQGLFALERARRGVLGQQYKTARLVPEEVLASARFRERVKRLATQLARSEQSIIDEAQGYLKEMEAMHNELAVHAWQAFVKRVISSYSIDVDEGQIENLRRLRSEHALIYLPSHRSYLDPFILRSVLHRRGLPPSYVMGGINTGFWPVGPVAKRNGIV